MVELPPFDTLVDVLRWRAAQHPERPLYSYVQDVEQELGRLTYREVDAMARALAYSLAKRAAPGDRALLLYPSSLAYPVAFLACLYAQVVAVPAYPPDPGRATQSLSRVLDIVRDAGARLILTSEECREFAELARESAPDPQAIEVYTTDAIAVQDADLWVAPPRSSAQPLAFLQYTSGSTGVPKGVMISHANLIAHQRLAHEVFRCQPEQTTVSWLPFYHDMGLIGPLLYPLYSGGHTVLMAPMSFLRRHSTGCTPSRATKRALAPAPTSPTTFAWSGCAPKTLQLSIFRAGN